MKQVTNNNKKSKKIQNADKDGLGGWFLFLFWGGWFFFKVCRWWIGFVGLWWGYLFW